MSADGERDALPAVRLRGVRRRFGAHTVLDGVDLDVAPGEFVSLVGASGSGKSTLLDLLAGVDDPDGGEIVVSGARAAPGLAALMPQRDALFEWRTVVDNCALGMRIHGVDRRTARARARAVLPAFGLAAFADHRPSSLSGGMRQRVALARTVLQDRDVLLLDEPLGALDALTRTRMQLWLHEIWLRDRPTVVMVTHDVREAVLLSDRVVVLADGRIARSFDVPIAHPRTAATPATSQFHALDARITAVLLES